jgi:hypothetical protein
LPESGSNVRSAHCGVDDVSLNEHSSACAGQPIRGAADATLAAGAIRAPIRRSTMVLAIHPAVAPLIALIAGIIILLVPRVLNYVIAIYLIAIGLLGLLGGHLNL